MQGRVWKSFLRPALIEKRSQILMLHVKSHDGLERPEQRGNDEADKIAKKLMNQAENLEPLPYFIAAREVPSISQGHTHHRQHSHMAQGTRTDTTSKRLEKA